MAYRTIRLGSPPGKDVEAWMRGIHKYLRSLDTFFDKPTIVRRTFGPGKKKVVAEFQRRAGIEVSGIIGPKTQAAIKPYLDQYARELLKEEPPLKLIPPFQGFASLHKSLLPLFSLGRHMGLGDGPGMSSGTYNPNSRLPSGARSDHAYYPSWAFDLDTDPGGPAGWDNPAARKFFNEAIGRPEVEYVILGPWIWYRGRGIHTYTGGGHFNHVHVSGRH
jgi:hypothetical protein